MEEKLKYEDSFVICDKHLGNYLGVYKMRIVIKHYI